MLKDEINLILKEFDEEFDNRKVVGDRIFKDYCPYLKEDIKSFISSRQISLIKMIVEMVESEKKETRFLDNGTMSVVGNWANPVFNSALDTISSKLKELYK